jgi:murein L,D-transpeptidase YafK
MKRVWIGTVLLFATGVAIGLWPRPVDSWSAPVTGIPLEKAIGERRPDLRKISLRVEKSAYRLTVYYKGRPVKSYPVVLGRNPTDDKLRQGDACTPEGTFRIQAQYPHKDWTRFLWLDYPTGQSRQRFRAARRSGVLPPSASIGGEVGIHGVPGRRDELVDKKVNWTLGCISLKTADIQELYRFTRVGTRVTIVH